MSKDELPKGVGSKQILPDGSEVLILDPFLRDMQWPKLRVDSSYFKTLPVYERQYLLSRAFLESAMALCKAAGQLGRDLNWPAGSVCLYCKYLGSELFLKACITRLDKNIPTHDLAKLLRRYRELLPNPKYDFPVSLAWRPRDVNDLMGIARDGIDLKPDEVLRYGADKEGKASSFTHVFAPGYQLNVLRDLHKRSVRIWASLPTSR
jgi:hypothetical protein